MVLHRGGLYKESEELGMQGMEMRKSVFGEVQPSTLTSMANLELTLPESGTVESGAVESGAVEVG
jgi:hypothetical protein